MWPYTRELVLSMVLALGLPAYPSGTLPDRFSNLLRNSPFGQPVKEIASLPAAAYPLELRGFVAENSALLFSVYETSSRLSRWVGLNESGHPFRVLSYNAEKDEIRVEHEGRDFWIGLKHARAEPIMSTSVPDVLDSEAMHRAKIVDQIQRRRAQDHAVQ